MCFKDAVLRLEKEGIDIGDTAQCAVIYQNIAPINRFDIACDGNHPLDDLIDLFIVGGN